MTQAASTQVFFHCTNAREVRIDRSGELVTSLAEARDRAIGFVRSLIMQRNGVDWRNWTLHVSDCDEELFVLPFSFVLGKPN